MLATKLTFTQDDDEMLHKDEKKNLKTVGDTMMKKSMKEMMEPIFSCFVESRRRKRRRSRARKR